eukprot:2023622-Pleurochrysis_carterae.AAC.1
MEDYVEVHVDLADCFDADRAASPLGGKFSVRFPSLSRPRLLPSAPSAELSDPGRPPPQPPAQPP